MKHPTDRFLRYLAAFELHRHAPAVLQKIASEENPNGVPLSENFFIVSYGIMPATILVKSIDDVLNTPGQREETRAGVQHFVDMVRKDGGGSMPLQVQAHRGGHITTFTLQSVPRNVLECGLGAVHAGDEEIERISRKPATDITDRGLPFILDEVDLYVTNARKYFSQSNTWDETSSRTIYHYVEEQVKNNRNLIAEAWRFYMA